MNLAKLTRVSGILLALGGLLLICAEIVYMLYPGPGHFEVTLPAQISAAFFFSGALFLTLGLPGVYLRQAEKAGTFGLVAFLVAFAGVALMVCSDWSEFFAGPALVQVPNFQQDTPAMLVAGWMLDYGMYTLGWLLFGISVIRARVLPRPLGIMLVVGILFPLIGFVDLHFPGDFLLGYTAFAWLGVAAAYPNRPARAPIAEAVAA